MPVTLRKKISRSLLSRLVCLLLGAAASQNSYAADTVVIALFGDSITVGENASFLGSRPGFGNGRQANDGLFPTLLPSEELSGVLGSERRQATIVNWGIGGSSTSSSGFGGAARILGQLSSTRQAFPADNYFVLILYGTNDFNAGLSPSSTQFNTLLMIDRARSLGFQPVIGTLTPRDDRNVTPYNTAIVAAANSRGAPIVDHFSRFLQDGNGGLDLLDTEPIGSGTIRLHPSAEGYNVIAQTWFDQFLENVIEPNRIVISPIINLLLD